MIVTSDTDLAAVALGCGYKLAEPAYERRGAKLFWHIETTDDLSSKFYIQTSGDFAVARRALQARKFLIGIAKRAT